MASLHLAEARVAPPPRLPHLFPALFSALACGHFVLAYLAAVALQWRAARTEPAHTPLEPDCGIDSAAASSPGCLMGDAAATAKSKRQ